MKILSEKKLKPMRCNHSVVKRVEHEVQFGNETPEFWEACVIDDEIYYDCDGCPLKES